MLLHHPFESFEVVVQFLREAVEDPQVLAIKQTIYRTGSESVLMELLLEAARRGKEVRRSRGAEGPLRRGGQHQLGRAAGGRGGPGGLRHRRPQDPRQAAAGHRREDRAAGLVRYAHLSTGNYNPKTARLYTDVGIPHRRPRPHGRCDAVLPAAGQPQPVAPPRQLLVAPFNLHAKWWNIGQVAQAARAGQPARIVAKFNALTDPDLIDALAAAARPVPRST
jgi:polyphosphate kinase